MAEGSKIEWCDHTINFWWGCTKISPACDNCYAERRDTQYHPGIPWQLRFQDEKATASHWGPNAPRLLRLEAATKEAMRYERRAVAEGRRFRVFTNSMADFFEDRRDLDDTRLAALNVMRQTPNLDWMILTKRPERIMALLRAILRHLCMRTSVFDMHQEDMLVWLSKWIQDGKPPVNIWLGTTVEDQQRADERISALVAVPAAIRFLSCEPLLGPVNLGLEDCWLGYTPTKDLLHWVIAGGESGPNARPMHPDWARGLRDQCAAAGIPFFFKQLGEWGPSAVVMTSGQPVYRVFKDFQHWKAKGYTWMSKGDIVLDASGKRCHMAGDLMRGQAPFTALRRVGKVAAGRLLDGVKHEQYPEVRRASQEAV